MQKDSPAPDLLAKLMYYVCPVRKKTIRENMRIVFGTDGSARDLKKLHQLFYAHLMRLAFENLSALWTSPEKLKQKVDVIGYEKVLKAAAQKKGILILTGHFGNWEMGAVGGMLGFAPFKGRFHILRKNIVNKFVEKTLFGRFERAGLNVVPKRNSLDRILGALADNDAVVFVMDQYAKPGHDGILVDFFGRPAGTFRSLALVARVTGAPVLPMVCYRRPDGKHTLEFSDPVPWIEHPEADREIHLNTLGYNRLLEKMVLANPAQWLWSHRRWKVKDI
ncbi:MAG: lysophospholipid acyltransferase family protein [Candidatus Omnitrophota bacterium]